MSTSYKNNRPTPMAASSETATQRFSKNSSSVDDNAAYRHPPGTLNDAVMVRSLVTQAFKNSTKSRAQIADEMSYLTGTSVSERMLNNFSAESRDDCRFPVELERAFCTAVGDDSLIVCRAEAHGLHVISADDLALLELGREYLRRKRAADAIAHLEHRLSGAAI